MAKDNDNIDIDGKDIRIDKSKESLWTDVKNWEKQLSWKYPKVSTLRLVAIHAGYRHMVGEDREANLDKFYQKQNALTTEVLLVQKLVMVAITLIMDSNYPEPLTAMDREHIFQQLMDSPDIQAIPPQVLERYRNYIALLVKKPKLDKAIVAGSELLGVPHTEVKPEEGGG